MDIFISYSTNDTEICEQLFDDLQRFYEVWIDRSELKGTDDWERSIENAINNSSIVLVLVSTDSTNSRWVRREIIYAESCNKVIIPLLLSGQLPLSLIDRQFIDLRGSYGSALTELVEIINKRIEPKDRQSEEVKRLVGDAIISFLWRDFTKANDKISIALTLNQSLGNNPSEFWNLLADSLTPSLEDNETLATSLSSLISINEECDFDGHYENGVPRYKWSIWINSNINVINNIEEVIYHLHPSFPNPIQKLRNREDKFKLTRLGWGTFNIRVDIRFIDNSISSLNYSLKFERKQNN